MGKLTMAKAFFEIDPKYVNTDGKGADKYSPEEYSRMTDSLRDVQESMNKGMSGKEILSQSPDQSNFGNAATYSQLYNPESGNGVEVNVDSEGNLLCGNGKHRCDSAREKNLFIPAQVICDNEQQLAEVKEKYGSSRELSGYHPVAEKEELLQEEAAEAFRNRYGKDTSADRTPQTNDNNELMSRNTNHNSINSNSETNTTNDVDASSKPLQNNYGQNDSSHSEAQDKLDRFKNEQIENGSLKGY
jgi:hypothetical protein